MIEQSKWMIQHDLLRPRVVELVLAALLFAAASLKSDQLIQSVSKLPGLNHRQPLFAALIQSELLLALWLLIGGFARPRFYCAITCFTLFAVVSTYEAIHAMPSCGCFGNVEVPPAATAALDVCAVIALFVTRPRHTGRSIDWPSRRRLVAGICPAIVFSGGLWGMYFLKVAPASAASAAAGQASAGGLVVLDSTSWLNRSFPLFDEIDGSAPVRTGRWLVVLYHFDCEDCRKAIPDYQAIAVSQSVFRVAFIAMPPFAPAGQEPIADSPDYLKLRLRPDHDWFATTPVVAAIENGIVLTAAEGDTALTPPDVPQWRR